MKSRLVSKVIGTLAGMTVSFALFGCNPQTFAQGATEPLTVAEDEDMKG